MKKLKIRTVPISRPTDSTPENCSFPDKFPAVGFRIARVPRLRFPIRINSAGKASSAVRLSESVHGKHVPYGFLPAE